MAINKLRERLSSLGLPDWPACEVKAVYPLSEAVRVHQASAPQFDAILHK